MVGCKRVAAIAGRTKENVVMKIFILNGFAPDLSEQSISTLAEVFTDETKALARYKELKEEIETLLEGEYENGRLEYYSVDCHEVKHNKHTLGNLVAEVTIAPGNDNHVDMWRDWSTLNIGLGSGFCIEPDHVYLAPTRSSYFRIASFSISIKEI